MNKPKASTDYSDQIEVVLKGIVAAAADDFYKAHAGKVKMSRTDKAAIADIRRLQFSEAKAKLQSLLHEVEVAAFKHGQRVGQYQAADRLYGHTTTMYLFKDEPTHPKAEWSVMIGELVKDCEKYMNHNAKDYRQYIQQLTTKAAQIREGL